MRRSRHGGNVDVHFVPPRDDGKNPGFLSPEQAYGRNAFFSMRGPGMTAFCGKETAVPQQIKADSSGIRRAKQKELPLFPVPDIPGAAWCCARKPLRRASSPCSCPRARGGQMTISAPASRRQNQYSSTMVLRFLGNWPGNGFPAGLILFSMRPEGRPFRGSGQARMPGGLPRQGIFLWSFYRKELVIHGLHGMIRPDCRRPLARRIHPEYL